MNEAFLREACELLNTLERGLVELGTQHSQSEATGHLLHTLHTLKAKAVAVGLCESACRQLGTDAPRDSSVHPTSSSLGPTTAETRLYQIVIRFEPEADHAAALSFLEQAALHGDLIEVETLYGNTCAHVGSEAEQSLGFRLKLRTQADPLALRAMCLNAVQAHEVQLTQLLPGEWSLKPTPPEPIASRARRSSAECWQDGVWVNQIVDWVSRLTDGLPELHTTATCADCAAARAQLSQLGHQLRDQVLHLRDHEDSGASRS